MQFKSYPKAVLRLEAAQERMYDLDASGYSAILEKIIAKQPYLYNVLYFVKQDFGGAAADVMLLDFFLIWYYFEDFAVKHPNAFSQRHYESELKLTFASIIYHGTAPNKEEANQAIDAQIEALLVPDLWKKIIEIFPTKAEFRGLDTKATTFCLVSLLTIVQVFGKLEAETSV